MSQTGPFYDLTDAQWQAVRENHARFIDGELGRPLIFGLATDVDAHARDDDVISLAGPRKRDPVADAAIVKCVREAGLLRDGMGRPDAFPALVVPRELYGHSQRLAEPFGGEPYMDAGHCQCRPSLHSMSDVQRLRPRPLEECPWLKRGMEVLRYFHESTEGRYPIRQLVTTGPIDTVNYITGTTLTLESLYTHPRELHAMLRMVTDFLIEHILACREATGGRIVPDHTPLLTGYTLCSELRSEYSADHYAEFEAPYLAEIGAAVGPLIIHASGRWEQSIAATLADPNVFHIVLWVRDTDLAVITDAVGGDMSIEAWRSDLKAYGFATHADYYRYLFERLHPETRFTLAWVVPDEYNAAYDEMDDAGTLPPQVKAYGRL